ncbi:TonB-dependent receptor [Pontibacter sp. SGAir0037]|uniref:TonB-dependent receptor n=1 Tax=Pontibacter sp. SGAir0037 TaxID=2571030 RepID=UPI0010CD0B4D|nr:TonB-dependent receptor [Pontibacter sp. SGAir0037]QCR23791.1 TonB-dependent siderophore receptor [Pontibacter sp. SGAir0037]
MKLSFITLLFIITASAHALSQGVVTVGGSVTTADGTAAEVVSVSLRGTGMGSTTDKNGIYKIEKVKPGTYTFRVSAIGLQTIEKVVAVPDEATFTVDFTLNESASQLQEVVIAGSRRTFKVDNPSETLRLTTPILETPQNIQIISSDLIKGQQIFDMSEGVSRNVSGVTMLEHWGNYTRVNMRGARVAPFRNGMNIESTWGPLSEDMSFVERIEFVKGPAGFMLANGDPAGFYNVVTKKPTGRTRQEVNFTFGSFNTFRATADLDGQLSADGKLLYRLNVMGQLKDSWRDFEYNDRYSIAPVLTYKFSDKTSLTAEYTHQYSRMSTIGSAYVFSARGFEDLPRNFTLADPNLKPSDMRDNSAFLTFEHKFNDKWKLTAQTAYFNYNQIGSSLWATGVATNGDMQRTVSSWDAQNISKFGQLFINGEFKSGAVTHKVLGGLDLGNKKYLADWNQYFVLDSGTPFNIYAPVYGLGTDAIPVIDRSKSLEERAGGNILAQKYGAIYVQDELGFFQNNLRLTLAGRYTKAETNQYTSIVNNEKFTPRVGVSASLNKATTVYALFDQAFIPQIGKLANEATVKPITGNNLEVGAKRDWFGGRWNSTVSVYQITKNNQLIGDPSDPSQTLSLQLGQTQTKGVEFDIRGDITPGLSAMFNYAYTDSKITKDIDPLLVGNYVPGFARHITNTWLSYRLYKGKLQGLGFSAGYQWQLGRYPWFVNGSSDSTLPDYFRLDGAVSYQFRKISLGVNVNNILDKYLYSGGPYDFNYDGTNDSFYWQTEAPRNYRVSIGYRF